MTPLNGRRECRKLSNYVVGAERLVNKMSIIPRGMRRYAFDTVGLATLSKGFALAKACLALLKCGSLDEAYGLSRSLVELSINLRFLTADPDLQDKRTYDFVKYALAAKSFWLHQALLQFAGKPEETEIREYAKREGITPNAKAARRHWSGLDGFVWQVTVAPHPLDGPITLAHRKVSFAMDYFQTSTFVHCSLPAIDNFVPEERSTFHVSSSAENNGRISQSTLFIILIYLHYAIAYTLFGMNLDRPPELDSLMKRTLAKMAPVPRVKT
jgi:hypothetical protein